MSLATSVNYHTVSVTRVLTVVTQCHMSHQMSAPMSLCAVVVLVAAARGSVMHLSSLQFKHNVNIHTQLVTTLVSLGSVL